HGAYAAVGQDFEQQAVRNAAVDDMYRIDAIASGFQGGRDFGQHAARNGAVFEQFVDVLGGQAAEQLAALVENPRGVGHHDELFGAQHFGNLARHQIGINVVGTTVFAIANGRNHRNELVILQGFDDSRFDTGNVAHIADIQHFAGAFVIGQHFFAGLDQAAVFAGQAYGLAAGLVNHHDDVLLNLASQNPFNDFHGFGIGYPHALN